LTKPWRTLPRLSSCIWKRWTIRLATSPRLRW
jgi:hypothetical protein